MTHRSTAAPLPKNALRTIVFVAAHGNVGRTVLGDYQRSLPPSDWDDIRLDRGWAPLKPVLSWSTALTGEMESRSVRDILSALAAAVNAPADAGRLARDVGHLLATSGPDVTLDASLAIPRTELGVRLSLGRRDATRRAYEAALRMCADASERFEPATRDAAARALRAALERMTPEVLYEAAADHRAVAEAILARRWSVQLRQDRFEVVFSIGDPRRVHRLYVLSRLGRGALARALGVSEGEIVKSHHLPEGVPVRALPDIEAELRRAAQAPMVGA